MQHNLDVEEKNGAVENDIKRITGIVQDIKTELDKIFGEHYPPEILTVCVDYCGKKDISRDIAQQRQSKTDQPQHRAFHDNDKEMGSATDKQKKACWAIIHGKNGRSELESELPDVIDNLSFEEASGFIERYGNKK